MGLAAASLAAIGIAAVAIQRKTASASRAIDQMEQAIRDYDAEQKDKDPCPQN